MSHNITSSRFLAGKVVLRVFVGATDAGSGINLITDTEGGGLSSYTMESERIPSSERELPCP